MHMPLGPLLHDLSLLYFALAFGTDGKLEREERAAMRDQLRAWAPGSDPSLFDHVLREAALSYENGLSDPQIDALLDRLRTALDAPGRDQVLADLSRLAAADDRVHDAEKALIERVKRAWAE